MKSVFVDTAGWMTLADSADPDHERAKTYRDHWLRSGGRLVSTDFVLDETLTLLRVRLGLDAAERWWNQVDGSSRLIWEWVEGLALTHVADQAWRDPLSVQGGSPAHLETDMKWAQKAAGRAARAAAAARAIEDHARTEFRYSVVTPAV